MSEVESGVGYGVGYGVQGKVSSHIIFFSSRSAAGADRRLKPSGVSRDLNAVICGNS